MKYTRTVSDIAAGFDIPDLASWLDQIRKELGSTKSPEDLNWLVEEGITINAYPPSSPLFEPIQWNSTGNWKIVEKWDSITLKESDTDLVGFGIDEVMLSIDEVRDLNYWLKEPMAARIDFCFQLPAALIDPEQVAGQNLRPGDFLMISPLDEKSIAELRQWKVNAGWHYAITSVGLTPTQQLTDILSQIRRFLKTTTPPLAGWRIYLPLDSHYQTQIAKIRALKILLLNLWQAYNLDMKNCPCIYARIPLSEEMDPYTNLIATTTMAMSAAIAGADALYFDYPSPSEHLNETRRLSRNIHHILKHESHLNHRIDPLAGSFLIENLTAAIATRVWDKVRGMDPGRAPK